MYTKAEEIRIPWEGWKQGRRLGSGSFGMVYEISRTVGRATEEAALKVISFPKEGMIEELQSDGYPVSSIREMCDSCREDLLREYGMMMRLKGHSNIVSCEDFTTEEREDGLGFRMYIRMELLQPLRDVLRERNLSEKEVIRLGRDLCRALVICHGRDIIHRDIKPQNIFRSEFGDYKLGDFGIARRMEGTERATVAGTTNYMAPEVYHHQPYGKDADLYSLGMVLYYLLNERRMPFIPVSEKIPSMQEEARALLRRVGGEKIPAPAGGSRALQEVVLRAVAYDRKDRYTSAEEMLAALRSVPEPADDKVPAAPVTPVTEAPYYEESGNETVSAFAALRNMQKPVDTAAEEAAEEVSAPVYDGDETVRTIGITGMKEETEQKRTTEIPASPTPASPAPAISPKPEAAPVQAAVQEKPVPETGRKPRERKARSKAPSVGSSRIPGIWIIAAAVTGMINCLLAVIMAVNKEVWYERNGIGELLGWLLFDHNLSSSIERHEWQRAAGMSAVILLMTILLMVGLVLLTRRKNKNGRIMLAAGGIFNAVFLLLNIGSFQFLLNNYGFFGAAPLFVRIHTVYTILSLILSAGVIYWAGQYLKE